jgi:hypothetical protein
MSQRAYARRRGVSHVAVQRAIREGRISASVVEGRIIDPDLADREWDTYTDPTRLPARVIDQRSAAASGSPAVAGMSTVEAATADKFWKAKLSELKFRQEAGELVPAADVEHRLEDVFLSCRTRLLGLPSRARQALPHLTLEDLAVLEGLVREALEELGRE